MLVVISVYLVLYRKKPPSAKKHDPIEEAVVEGVAGEP